MNAEAALHLSFDQYDVDFVTLGGVAREQRDVVFERIVRPEPCIIERIQRHTDSVGCIES